MSDDVGHDRQIPDLGTWTIDQLEHHLATLEPGREIERVRVVAQAHAYRSEESRDVRRRWARLSLTANARLPGDGLWDRTRRGEQNFALRMWIIEHFGPGEDPDWDPAALAADTLAVLSLDTHQAALMSAQWRELPIEQISELRRHKNLTAHLDRLVGYLRAGPTKDRLVAWLEFREQLP